MYYMYGDCMTISIRNHEAERLARELAASGDKTLTEVVLEALRSYRMQQTELRKRQPDLAERLLAIGAHCAQLPDRDIRSADEIMGYDESGLPT